MGFDNECIQNIQSLAGEYFCPVCRLLVYPNEALQSQCTHLYCKPCLAYIANSSRACPYDGYLVTEADSKPLIESNKALAETINKIAVHCLYHRSGCTWQGPLSECITHCSGCAFGNSPVVCNRCGIQIVHRQVQDHAQSCPGVQPQAQKTVPSHEATAASAAATNLSQISKPAGPASSQTQTSKAVNEAAVPTPELWYQQQYHQYYQQYAGYGTYNPQYQQYYPHQQQQEAVQPQPYPQSQPQIQPQMPPQSQLQGPVLSQLKQQLPSNVQQPTPPPQPQAQAQPHGQPQANMQPQVQTQVPAVPASLPPNHQQQLQSAVLPYPQPNMQSHPTQTQFNPPHSHLLQHPQIPTQTSMQLHSQPPIHYPPPHPQPLPNSHAQPHSQAQPHGSAPHPQVLHHMHHSQPNPPANALSQPQVQSVPAVPGYQSHPPPLPSSQLQLGGPQQHLVPIRPPQQSQQSAQVHGQGLFTHSSLPVRPAPVQAMVPNQQNAGLLQPPPCSTSFPPAQQSLYPQAQQSGQIVSPSTIMQPAQQHISQPTSQHPQPPFGGQQLGLNQNQLYQQGPLPQQHMLMQPQMRPQVLTPSHPPQPQQSLQHSHSSQNPVGRLPIPNHGVPFQVSQLGMIQVRPSQPSFNPNNLVVPNSQVQSSSEEQLGTVLQPRMLERSVTNIQTDLSSQNTAKMDEKSLGGNAREMNEVKSEMDAKHPVVSSKASENQVASNKQIARQETAQHEVGPSDAESGKGFLKDQKDFHTSSPKPDGKSILSERENQEGPLRGPLVQQNELFEERIQNDTNLVLEPSGSEKVPAAAVHGADDSRNVPPAGQNTARGVALPPLQQRATAPPGLPAIPGPPHQLHSQGQPLNQFGHPGSGNLQLRQINPPYQVPSSFSKQPFEPAISSGGKPVHGSQPPFGKGQGQFQHQFAPQLVPHDHGHLHQRMHFREPHGEIPPGALDKSGGMFISEKHAPNTVGVEKLTERRPFYMDSRQTDPNLQGTLEQGSWGPTLRINRPLGVDSPLFLDQEKRFKSLRDEHMHASAVNLTRQVYDQRGFQVELKSIHDPIAKHGNQYTSGSHFDGGPFEKAFHGLTTDGAGSTSLRTLPPYRRDVDIGKRPFGPPEDNIERLGSSHMHTDVLGLDPSYSRRYMGDSAIRTPGEYDGLPSRSFKGPPGISQGSLGPGDIVRRESRSFGSFPGSRFHGLPGHLNKSGFEYPGNLGVGEHLRNGDLMGHDLPSHVRRREHLGPQNLRLGEAGGFGTFHDRALAGEPIVPEVYGGQLGSRRPLSLQGHSTDGYKSNEPFDDLRRRRVTSMGWCRICKVDCETVDGLDLHSQTMGHQKAAMDIVRSIKQQNAKKQKLSSSDKSSVEDPSKSRTPNSEVLGRNH